MDTPQNPYSNPTSGKYGLTHEILQSRTDDELVEYTLHLSWRQVNSTFPTRPTNPYASRGYFLYRTGNWVFQCRDILKARGIDPDAAIAKRKKRRKK